MPSIARLLPLLGEDYERKFGSASKNCISFWTTVSYSILWVKFSPRGLPARGDIPGPLRSLGF
jgi:hypothetical protein